MSQLLVVANRLPVTVDKDDDGGLRFSPSAGGLATGLRSLFQERRGLWIGWPGLALEDTSADERRQMTRRLRGDDCHPVFLTRQDVEDYYLGFANRTLWPLTHYFIQYAVYDWDLWSAYRRVNEKFADTVAAAAEPGDTIWVHDYHLMLLPHLLRERLPDASIGFFFHVPFPAFEVFRLLPWRREIVEGLLAADLIGFHTYDYVLHFLDSAQRLLGLEHHLGRISLGHRMVSVDAFPMGIDYERFASAGGDRKVRREAARVRAELEDRALVLSVDRLDYSKGIPQRLQGFDRFLQRHPEYRERVVLLLVAVPSRTEVDHYQQLHSQIEESISDINGRHGALGWVPVWYWYRSLPFHSLTALYREAHVAMVTPVRDGMNLIAKEFVASRDDGRGVLVLSEMAGAVKELSEALVVNPNNVEELARALHEALTIPEAEQVRRNRAMQERLRRFDVGDWAQHFIDELSSTHEMQREFESRRLTGRRRRGLCDAYEQSERRLLLLDYDGTLVSFADRPEGAAPDDAVRDLLARLARDPRNRVVIISGRDRGTLQRWLGALDVDMVAEHGAWFRSREDEWYPYQPLTADWKEQIRPILDLYAGNTPGAAVEEKTFSLAWHYRRADPALASIRANELTHALMQLTAPLRLSIEQGNHVIEVRDANISKGHAAADWLHPDPEHTEPAWDFVLAMGDDVTDEDMFRVLPDDAASIKIGLGPTRARFYLHGPAEARALLAELAQAS